MNLIEEQISAYKRMVKYLEAQIHRLERKMNVSRFYDGKIFSERCCIDKNEHRIHLPVVNKNDAF
jgi:hypothetical protein